MILLDPINKDQVRSFAKFQNALQEKPIKLSHSIHNNHSQKLQEIENSANLLLKEQFSSNKLFSSDNYL